MHNRWFTMTVCKGLLRPITDRDIYNLPKTISAKSLNRQFECWWGIFSKRCPQPLYCTFFCMYWQRLLFCFFLKLVSDICVLASPKILKRVIELIMLTTMAGIPDSMKPTAAESYFWIVVLGIISFTQAFCNNHFVYNAVWIGTQTSSSLISKIFQKSLRLSSKARASRSSGKIVNLMSTDAQKLQYFSQFFIMLESAVLNCVYSLYGLWELVGWATAAGIASIFIVIPMAFALVIIYLFFRTKVLKLSDKRVQLINEILQGIRTIKYFNWETSYEEVVNSIRRKEILLQILMGIDRTGMMALIQSAPNVVAMVTFGLYALFIAEKGVLGPNIIFPALNYLNILRMPLLLLPMIVIFLLDSHISIVRLTSFFNEGETVEYLKGDYPSKPNEEDPLEEYPLIFEKANFEWGVSMETLKNQQKGPGQRKKPNPMKLLATCCGGLMHPFNTLGFCCVKMKESRANRKNPKKGESEKAARLNEISFKLPKNKLTVVCGAVGSGKSSLIQAILGEMQFLSGDCYLRGQLGYTSQQAWAINGSIKDNILFGNAFDEKRYKEAIHFACLEKDLEVLPNGELTEIGEKGVTLSGGQKQRVNLARAIYLDSDIYLLDDPLSAVDAHVGRFLFEKCFKGKLSGKTVFLVTHQLQYCHDADYIIVMDHGSILEQGTFEELTVNPDSKFSTMMKEVTKEEENQETKDKKKDDEKVDKTKKAAQKKSVVADEDKATGNVSPIVLWRYLQYMGGVIVLLLILALFVFSQFIMTYQNIFMTFWTTMAFHKKFISDAQWLDCNIVNIFFKWGCTQQFLFNWTIKDSAKNLVFVYLTIYCGCGFLSIIIGVFRDSFLRFAGIRASYMLFKKAFHHVLYAPSGFYDTTPVGRMLSRLTKDVEILDTTFLDFMGQFFVMGFLVIGMFGTVIYSTDGLFLYIMIPACVVYIVIYMLYRSTQRELKRIEAVARSPLYTHFSEALSGIPIIRAFSKQKYFIESNLEKLDLSMRCYFSSQVGSRWLGIRLELTGAAMIVFASAAFLLVLKDTMNPGLAGLSLSMLFAITAILSQTIQQSIELESNLNSVERVVHYITSLPQEPPHKIPKKLQVKDVRDAIQGEKWPQFGEIFYKNFSFRYRDGLPLVLDNVNILIHAGEKVGVCGRTGAGKSTLMLALYRFNEPAGGCVLVDGVDIGNMPLSHLRRKVSIIPQEPTLFTGSVRFNLDPFDEKSEAELWKVLERAHLKETIMNLKRKLDSDVGEGGSNFSVGQRQLICLARALAKPSRILVLDEATANVDFQTDALIQTTIREQFKDCTRLTIAHRINTIIDSDRILVLDKGRIAEFDTPRNLLLKRDSVFSSLVDETHNSSLRRQVFGDADYERIFGPLSPASPQSPRNNNNSNTDVDRSEMPMSPSVFIEEESN